MLYACMAKNDKTQRIHGAGICTPTLTPRCNFPNNPNVGKYSSTMDSLPWYIPKNNKIACKVCENEDKPEDDTGWGPQDSVKLPYFSGFMVDITN